MSGLRVFFDLVSQLDEQYLIAYNTDGLKVPNEVVDSYLPQYNKIADIYQIYFI